MKDVLDHAALKTKQRAIRAGFPETMGLRAHRAISWIGRAEACGDDDDARFIFLWIAFNAAYADEREFQTVAPGERAAFVDYFGKLVALDDGRRIYNALWQRFSGPVRMLMENRYVLTRSGSTTTESTGSRIGTIASRYRPVPLLKRSRPVTQPRC